MHATSIMHRLPLPPIKKNVNARAKSLHHDLNKTKDTLVLRSSKKMFRVYTVGDFGGVVDQYLNTYEYEVPLKGLEKGKYVFVVDQSKMKIVFQVLIHEDTKGHDIALLADVAEQMKPIIGINAKQPLLDLSQEIMKELGEQQESQLKARLALTQNLEERG